MHALALEIELRFPGARSLKDKRARLRPIVDRLRHRHHVSVAEIARADHHQLATVGVALVGGSVAFVEELADVVERLCWAADADVIQIRRYWLDTA